jgi:threonine synthase
MTNVEYINPRSGGRWSTDAPIWRAPDDGGHVNLTPGKGLTRNEIAPSEIGLWRYRKSIRIPSADTSTLGEGWTPLVRSDWDGVSILMKCEHMMPSGSFKDRGTVVLFNYLKQCGTTEILEDSSGNAGASYATYAAALGLDCRIMVPASAPAGKKTQIAAMGARIEAIAGSREDVAAAALKTAETTFYASHNWQPFFIEGTKTLAFEIWEQLGFSVPDNIVVPLGYGSNVIGLHLGFLELQAAGEIDRLPRIFGAQAANCAALHAAWEAGGTAVDFPILETLADGIASEKPVRVAEVMTATRQTGGTIVVANEDEIGMAFRRLAGVGFFVEPTSATAGAALSRLVETRVVGREETTVLVLTGHGLKAVDKIARMSKG